MGGYGSITYLTQKQVPIIINFPFGKGVVDEAGIRNKNSHRQFLISFEKQKKEEQP
jgi:hypothetical protein